MREREVLVKLAEYNGLRKQLLLLLNEKAELDEAEKILGTAKPRRIYRHVGPLIIEVDKEEALKYIEDRREIVELEIEKIKKEISKIYKEVKEFIPSASIPRTQ